MTERDRVIKGLECCINGGDCQNQCGEWPDNGCEKELMLSALSLLKDPDRVKVVRCRDCRFWKANNAEEGDASGMCMNGYSPAGTTDMNWFCADGERVSE